jgi:hypothetical protein
MLYVVTNQKPVVTKPRVLSPLLCQMPMLRNLQRRFCLWRRKASAPRYICDAVKTNAKCVEQSGRGLISRAQSREPRSKYNAKMHRVSISLMNAEHKMYRENNFGTHIEIFVYKTKYH